MGGTLWVINTADGKRTASIKLSAPPVFDGMAVANGQVIMAQQDHTLSCYAE